MILSSILFTIPSLERVLGCCLDKGLIWEGVLALGDGVLVEIFRGFSLDPYGSKSDFIRLFGINGFRAGIFTSPTICIGVNLGLGEKGLLSSGVCLTFDWSRL